MKRPEQEIQKAIVQHLRFRGVSGLVWWHTPNAIAGGERKHRIQGAIGKSLGVLAGVSDLVLLHQGKFHALEIKVGKNKPTNAQLKFIEDVRLAGGEAGWCRGLDRALTILERWKLIT